jgi:hypothetical protein
MGIRIMPALSTPKGRNVSRVVRQILVSVLVLVGPIYLLERVADRLYFAGNPAFYTVSGFRFDFFIAYCFLAAVLVGYFVDSLIVGFGSMVFAVAVLLLLFYGACDPHVCYFIGLDKLEPFRLGCFFVAETLLGTVSGRQIRVRTGLTTKAAIATGLAFSYVLGYYPTVYSFAGAQHDSLGLSASVLLVVPISLAAALTVAGKTRRWGLGALVPVAGLALVLGLTSGFGGQYIVYTLTILLAVILLSAVSGIIGSLIARSRSGTYLFSSPRRYAFTVAILVLLIVTGTYANASGGLVVQGSSGEANDWLGNPPYYVGAFMLGDYFGVKGVAVNVDFGGTVPSVIQSDNYLAAGIGVQSPSCCVDGLDYGYRVDMYLFHGGKTILVANAWQTCDTNVACGARPWRNSMLRVNLEISGPLTPLWLAMEWNVRAVSWYYGEDLRSLQTFASFNPTGLENPAFNVGVLKGILSNRPTSSAYFFQFGIASRYPIGHGGWRVRFSRPSYLLDGSWTSVPHAQSIQGAVSYWKVLWRWGESYDRVSVLAEPATPSVTFQFADSTLTSFQDLW